MYNKGDKLIVLDTRINKGHKFLGPLIGKTVTFDSYVCSHGEKYINIEEIKGSGYYPVRFGSAIPEEAGFFD